MKQDKTERRLSLGTKDLGAAAILAFQLNTSIETERAMRNPKGADILAKLDPAKLREYKVNLREGTIEANGPKDHALAMDALARPPRRCREPSPTSAQRARHRRPPCDISKSLEEVGKLWLAERNQKNAPRTVYAKRRHLANFVRQVSGGAEVNAIVKATIVAYRTSMPNDGLTGKTQDNKLMSLHDLFAFALSHGHYTASNENPVGGLFVLDRKSRVSKNKPYQPFSPEEIARFFEPATYRAAMALLDFFWAPLIAIYTGMRISEASAIASAYVQREPGGVHFIQVPKGKTADAARNGRFAMRL